MLIESTLASLSSSQRRVHAGEDILQILRQLITTEHLQNFLLLGSHDDDLKLDEDGSIGAIMEWKASLDQNTVEGSTMKATTISLLPFDLQGVEEILSIQIPSSLTKGRYRRRPVEILSQKGDIAANLLRF